MDYSKFYTPPEIASALINELAISKPQKIVDICCGSCNLLFAAKKKWTEAILYGVDITDQSFSEKVVFEKKDGRQFSIEHSHEFSLVVANPPFDYVDTKKQFPELFVNEFEELYTSRLEIEMLIANIRLLQQDGVLLIILPSSFVEAETYEKIRKIIANNYYIESIIKLDENTFGSSKIKSYALIIHNKPHIDYPTKIGVYLKKDNIISYIDNVDSGFLKCGAWTSADTHRYNLEFNIKRGTISSSSFVKKGQTILHTAKPRDNWEPSKRYVSTKVTPTVFAESGDIIVSRIGKSAGQWCVYNGEKVAISDCLFRIKDPNGSISKMIRGKSFDRELKGVATRYITMSDFCSWINHISQI